MSYSRIIYFLTIICIFLSNATFSYSEAYNKNDNKTIFSEDVKIQNLENEIKKIKLEIDKLQKQRNEKALNNSQNLKIGVALSGGGAKGFAHLGILKVLEEENIKIDYISGTSIGALIASLYSVGYNLEEIEKFMSVMNLENFFNMKPNEKNMPIARKDFLDLHSFNINFDKNFNIYLPSGLVSSQSIYQMLKKMFQKYPGEVDFNKLPIPIRIVATNLKTGENTTLVKGDLAKSVAASIAIPPILEPIKIGDNEYIDGGVRRNIPVEETYNMGADIVIACDIGSSIDEKENYDLISMTKQIIAIYSKEDNTNQLKKATITIEPDVEKFSVVDIYSSAKLKEAGELAAKNKIEILKKLPKKNSENKKRNYNDNEKKLEYYIEKISFEGDFTEQQKQYLYMAFSDYENQKLSIEKIDEINSNIYNYMFVNKIYYSINGNNLIFYGDKQHENVVGIGLKYNTDYGTSLSIGSDFIVSSKLGHKLSADIKLGRYNSLNLYTNILPGSKNMFGFYSEINLAENPLFFYEKNQRVASFKNREASVAIGAIGNISNNKEILIGAEANYSNIKLSFGDFKNKIHEKSAQEFSLISKIKYNSLDSIQVPNSGTKFNAKLKLNINENKDHLIINPSFNFNKYMKVTDNNTLIVGGAGAYINSENPPLNRYIKLGGNRDNLDNSEFALYGYASQEKLTNNFLALRLGLRSRLTSSVYLVNKFNLAYYNDLGNIFYLNNQLQTKKFDVGILSGMMFITPLGRVEFSLSNNLRSRNFVGSFSIGYNLD